MNIKALLLIILLCARPLDAVAWTGTVVNIIDGDSLKILPSGHEELETRLYGIDAPEFRQAFGRAAKKNLAALLAGQEVEVETKDLDSHNRLIVMIWLKDMNVNEKVIRDGYAWVYRHFCRESFCSDWLALEAAAREGKQGLWQENKPVPPWEFRHRK